MSAGELPRRNEGNAKAQVEAPVRRQEPGPGRRPAELDRIVPTAAPAHPDRARGGPQRVARTIRAVILVVLVGAPLPYVTVHVEKAPGVCHLRPYLVRPVVTIRGIPRH